MTTARFSSVCPETGRPIRRGDPIAYYPRTKKAFHECSEAAAQVRALAFSRSYQMPDANW
jgi:hypothetical protein